MELFKNDRDSLWHYNQFGRRRSLKERAQELKMRIEELKLDTETSMAKSPEVVGRSISPQASGRALSSLCGYEVAKHRKNQWLIRFAGKEDFRIILTAKGMLSSHNLPKGIVKVLKGQPVGDKYAYAEEICVLLKAREARTIQAQRMTDSYYRKGVSLVKMNKATSHILIHLNIRDTDKNKIEIRLDLSYEEDGHRPYRVRIKGISHALAPEDVELLQEQCEVFYKMDIDKALAISFLN